MRKKAGILFLIVAIGSVLYIIMDYLDLPSLLGVNISRINSEMLSIFINTVVVITLYVLTYILIDVRNVKKQKNQESSAKLIMSETYKECKRYAELLETPNVLKSLVSNTKFDKIEKNGGVSSRYASIPFDNEELLYQFVADGSITAEQFNLYLKIKNQYRGLVQFSVTFFDHPEVIDQVKRGLKELLEEAEIQFGDYNNTKKTGTQKKKARKE